MATSADERTAFWTMILAFLTLALVVVGGCQLRALRIQQQKLVVMQLWSEWDATLDTGETFGETRKLLLQFTYWLENETKGEYRKKLLSAIAGIDGYSEDELQPIIQESTDVSIRFIGQDKPLSKKVLRDTRYALVRFLNMLEKNVIAYEEGIADKGVMDETMRGVDEKYARSLEPFIEAIQELPGEEDTYTVIVKSLLSEQDTDEKDRKSPPAVPEQDKDAAA